MLIILLTLLHSDGDQKRRQIWLKDKRLQGLIPKRFYLCFLEQVCILLALGRSFILQQCPPAQCMILVQGKLKNPRAIQYISLRLRSNYQWRTIKSDPFKVPMSFLGGVLLSAKYKMQESQIYVPLFLCGLVDFVSNKYSLKWFQAVFLKSK